MNLEERVWAVSGVEKPLPTIIKAALSEMPCVGSVEKRALSGCLPIFDLRATSSYNR